MLPSGAGEITRIPVCLLNPNQQDGSKLCGKYCAIHTNYKNEFRKKIVILLNYKKLQYSVFLILRETLTLNLNSFFNYLGIY